MTKKCCTCKQDLPLSCFHRNKNTRDGFHYRCYPCRLQREDRRSLAVARERRYYARHRQEVLARQKARRTTSQRLAEYHRNKGTPQAQARRELKEAVRLGLVKKPDQCERCSKLTAGRYLHAHHADYGKPLEVEWLCSICHGIEHRKYPRAADALAPATPDGVNRNDTWDVL